MNGDLDVFRVEAPWIYHSKYCGSHNGVKKNCNILGDSRDSYVKQLEMILDFTITLCCFKNFPWKITILYKVNKLSCWPLYIKNGEYRKTSVASCCYLLAEVLAKRSHCLV